MRLKELFRCGASFDQNLTTFPGQLSPGLGANYTICSESWELLRTDQFSNNSFPQSMTHDHQSSGNSVRQER